jgi:hypothetical protein
VSNDHESADPPGPSVDERRRDHSLVVRHAGHCDLVSVRAAGVSTCWHGVRHRRVAWSEVAGVEGFEGTSGSRLVHVRTTDGGRFALGAPADLRPTCQDVHFEQKVAEVIGFYENVVGSTLGLGSGHPALLAASEPATTQAPLTARAAEAFVTLGQVVQWGVEVRCGFEPARGCSAARSTSSSAYRTSCCVMAAVFGGQATLEAFRTEHAWWQRLLLGRFRCPARGGGVCDRDHRLDHAQSGVERVLAVRAPSGRGHAVSPGAGGRPGCARGDGLGRRDDIAGFPPAWVRSADPGRSEREHPA